MLLCSPAAVVRKLSFSILVNPTCYVPAARSVSHTAAHPRIQGGTQLAQILLTPRSQAQQATQVLETPQASQQGQEAAHLQCKEDGPSSSQGVPVSREAIVNTSITHPTKKVSTSSSQSAIRKPGSVRFKSKDGKAPGVENDDYMWQSLAHHASQSLYVPAK